MTDFERYTAVYSPELTRFCMKLCGDVHDAEDLFQDTWTRVFDRFEQYDPEQSFKSWLFAICANIFKNSKKQKYNSSRAVFSSKEEKERFLLSIPDEEKDLDAYLDLYDAIYALPKKHRVVLVLYYFREFSQSEIARMLDIPEGTVKSRLNTAKKLLKRRLSYEEYQR
ncbi:MAG: RNA polymerase sigma factor [Ruminococcus sp.]|nr:RNA polymerase sigma factor [Ruminococcus sp.]